MYILDLTCSSSWIDAERGTPSLARAIRVSRAIVKTFVKHPGLKLCEYSLHKGLKIKFFI